MSWQTLGFDKIKSHFDKLLKHGGLNHAYLFSGQEMIGKRTYALELAAKIADTPIGTADMNHKIIDPSDSESGQSISIENIRELKNFLNLSSYGGGMKTAIINDAHFMTVEAQNALLKVLEEPSQSTMFILVSASPILLLPTITSRCQEIKFPTHNPQIIKEFLSHSKISATQSDFIVKMVNGRIGLAKYIVESENHGGFKEAIEELAELLSSDLNVRFAIAQKLTEDKNKTEFQKKILFWILYMRTKTNDDKSGKILKNLLKLHYKSTQPQLNQRLALESFLVSI
jgi:DNA polymerase-3 subunit delta'